MTDPVIGDDGQTYERAAIERVLVANPISPMTRQRMTAASLKPNYALRSAIQRWRSGATKVQTPTPSAPSATHTHTEYVLLITPEVQNEQERLLAKRPTTTTTGTAVTQEEHRRRMCRASLILCLLMVVLIFVFHALTN